MAIWTEDYYGNYVTKSEYSYNQSDMEQAYVHGQFDLLDQLKWTRIEIPVIVAPSKYPTPWKTIQTSSLDNMIMGIQRWICETLRESDGKILTFRNSNGKSVIVYVEKSETAALAKLRWGK